MADFINLNDTLIGNLIKIVKAEHLTVLKRLGFTAAQIGKELKQTPQNISLTLKNSNREIHLVDSENELAQGVSRPTASSSSLSTSGNEVVSGEAELAHGESRGANSDSSDISPIVKSNRKESMTLLPVGLLNRVRAEANRQSMSVAEFIRTAVIEYLLQIRKSGK